MKKQPRILFLEDVPSEAALVDHELRKAGLSCEIKRVDSKQAFLAALTEHPPDIILSDHGLPAFDGSAALKLAREKCPHIPFIFVTDSSADLPPHPTEHGATGHVLKKELPRLAPAIRQALRLPETDFRSLIQSLTDCAIMELNDKGRVTFWSAGAVELFGYTPEEMAGRDLSILYPHEGPIRRQPGLLLKKAREHGQWEEEAWRVTKSGDPIYVQLAIRMLRAPNGRLRGFLKVARRLGSPVPIMRALPTTDERYRQLVEKTPCSILVINDTGNILFANRSSVRLLGAKTKEELLGTTFQQISPPNEGRKILERIGEAHGNGVEFIEHEMVRLDGSRVLVEITATSVNYLGGPKLEVIIHDLTERRRAEQALAEKEHHLRVILESALDAIVSIDHRGVVREWNPAAERIFGYKRSEALNRPVDELVIPRSYRARYREGLTQYLMTGACSLVGRPVQLTLHRANGEEFPAELSITRTTVGETPSCTALVRDITERQRAETELRHSEERFRIMVESVTDYAIYMMDATGRVETWNAGAERLEGYDSESIIGRPFSTFFTPEDVKAGVPAMILQRAEADGRFLNEGWRVRKDGSRFWSRGVVTALRNEDGTLRGFSKVAQDLTRQKKYEEDIVRFNQTLEQRVEERTAQLQAANEELEAFSYSVSHDLRAPLRHIAGYVDILASEAADALDDTAKRHLGAISDATNKMGALIEALLAFSRLGRAEMRRSSVQLGPLVEQVRRELSSETNDRNVEWKIGRLPVVRGDVFLLRQAMVNLMENALKYTRPRNPAVIEIGAESTAEEDIIFVRDNGVGFDMSYANKLFGVFQRLHRPSEFEGTGIGLANVRRIIHRHGGRTWAEGKVDQGATFYLSLPKPKKGDS